ncbi:gem-associated protein 2 isoform X6 [Macaca fascicularis]|uniref:gem-associated protein 2 isoform X6 n=1 Tax=Macaca fascicularis TaxID=9541 RepID=UPI0032B08D57
MAWVPAESAVEELMPRLLPVEPCDLTEGFDPSVPPRTPQEYLRRVQIEAAQCPDVVVAQIDPKKLKRKQSVNISLSGCQPAPEGYSPTLQWQQQQVAQFSTVRQNVNKHRSHWKSQQLDSNVTMIGFPPLLSIVSRMNQATVTSVLEYLSNWFGERDFTPELVLGMLRQDPGGGGCSEPRSHHCTPAWATRAKLRLKKKKKVIHTNRKNKNILKGRWLYALLACLEKPLLPEAHSLIRQLARRCSEVRLLVDSKDDERVPALNLLICLVSRYFDQRDLADEPS